MALESKTDIHELVGTCSGCEDPECMPCGAKECIHGDPLHGHHDGCPSCYTTSIAGPLVMAFDFEKAGWTDEFDDVGFGASVVDSNFHQLDSMFCPMLRKDTKFHPPCWAGFWSKDENKSQLKTLTYDGPLDKVAREREVFEEFKKFRRRWEQIAKSRGVSLELVSDNNVFDGRLVNNWYRRFAPNEMPLPYDTAGKYSTFWETDSMLRGILAVVDPKHTSPWGLTARVRELYSAPKPEFESDHRPDHDAYEIAFDGQLVLAIRNGRLKLQANFKQN